MSGVRPYIVRQGDYVAKIAAQLGCSEDEIWSQEKNKELQESGRTKGVLNPGDVLFVPTNTTRRASVEVEGANDYQGQVPRVVVTIRFRADDKPCVGRRYRVLDAADEVQGETDSDGSMNFAMPVTSRYARVVFMDPPTVLVVDVGSVDPVEERSGVRCRLRQLGYLPWDAADADATEEAIAAALKAFQAGHDLAPTGVADEETEQRLRKEFGGR